MHATGGVVGLVLIAIIAWDVFEAMILPRRVTQRLRPRRFFYRVTWRAWAWLARRLPAGRRRETYLSFFGPLSLLVLFAAWAMSLVVGFALLEWSLGSPLEVSGHAAAFADDLYVSGTTFFTLGLGDVVPRGAAARLLTVIESGIGFGFLAVVIGYLPVLYQAFSRREVNISLLDARAGSPPSAAELLRRHGSDMDALAQLLAGWERWSAELLESHMSYPVLAYFRSQHDNESWLGALTAILDAAALTVVGIEGACARQAQLTFAIARHAVVDLVQVLGPAPRTDGPDRLPPERARRLRAWLAAEGVVLRADDVADRRLAELRRLYEPYVQALAAYLLVTLPPWHVGEDAPRENWRTSAWEQSGEGSAPPRRPPHRDDVHG